MRTTIQIFAGSLIVAMAAIVLFPRQTPAAPPAINVADFRGSDTPLLTTPDMTISERDFFLYTVMTRFLNPELVTRWRDLNKAEKETVRENLLRYVQAVQYSQLMMGEESAREIELGVRAERIFAGPVAQLLWADYVIRESVVIFPEDVAFYYARNAALYSESATVALRRLRVPLPAGATGEQRDAALARAEELRQRAATSGGLAPLLAADPSLLIDPPGRLLEIARDTEGVDPQIIDEGFRLGLGQISSPIRTPAGYVLVEIVEKNEPEQVRLVDVLPEVEADLMRKFLPQQFDYLLFQEITRSHAISRAHLYAFMPDDAFLVQVHDFKLERGEFLALYPEIVGSPEEPDKLAIQATASDILGGEVVTQLLEERGLIDDPFYQDSLELARVFQRAATYIRREREKINPTDEEITEYVAANRDELQPGAAKVVWRYQMSVREDQLITLAERDTMRILVTRYLDELRRDAQRQVDDRRQIGGDGALREPDQVVRQLREPEDRRMRTRFERIGRITGEEAATRLETDFDSLELGRFTAPIETRDGRIVSYYVGEIAEARPLTEAEFRETARVKLVNERATALVKGKVYDMVADGRIRFARELEVAPATP